MADVSSGLGKHSAQDCNPARGSEKIQLQVIFSYFVEEKVQRSCMHPAFTTPEDQKLWPVQEQHCRGPETEG